MSIPIYLAVFPEESARADGYPKAQLGCRLSQESPALLAPDPPDEAASLMVLRDDVTPAYEAAPSLAGMLASYARNYHAGLVCDWRKSDAAFFTSLAGLLEDACAAQGLPLWLNEPFAEGTKEAQVMIRTDITEGTFRQRLQKAAARWPGRCVLALRPLRVRCILPGGGGRPEMESLPALEEEGPVFFSEELSCMYSSRPEGEGVAFTLYDTRETMEKKLRAAEEAGFRAAVGQISELSHLPE